MQEVMEAKRQLDLEVSEAKLMWDFKSYYPLEDYWIAATRLHLAYMNWYGKEASAGEKRKHQEILFVPGVPADDRFGKELDEMVSSAEILLGPKLMLGGVRRDSQRNGVKVWLQKWWRDRRRA